MNHRNLAEMLISNKENQIRLFCYQVISPDIAIEIETGNSNAIENIRKCLDAKFGLVISVPLSRQIETQIKERLGKENLNGHKKVFVINSEKFE